MRSRLTRFACVCTAIVFALIVLSPISLRAQEARGTISGTVMDSNKAVVPGARVTITNVAMGITNTATTNESGLYTVPYLIPGTYRVIAEAAGFKKYIREGIALQVNDKLEIDAVLEVGGSQET